MVRVAAVVVVLALLLPHGTVRAQTSSGLGAALQWLVQHQNPDGGFGSPSSVSTTAQALVALATPWEGVYVSSAVDHAFSYIRSNWDKAAVDAGTLGYIAMALRALGRPASDGLVGGQNVASAIESTYNPTTGLYGAYLYQHGIAVLGLAAAGQAVASSAVERILAMQAPNGGWSWNGSGQDADSDTNTTSIMVQALVAAGRADDPAVSKALEFLARHAAEQGGYAFQHFPGTALEADANSTALVLQAVLAADQDPNDPSWGNPISALLRFQNPSGAFRWTDASPEDNLLSTVQAIPAAAQRFLPFSASDASGKRSRVLAARSVGGAVTGPERVFFPQTGHTLAYGFKSFWERNGGLAVFGYPLTEEFDEYNGTGQRHTVQYFERARFEYYPELRGSPFEVQLGLIGREVLSLQGISFPQGERRPEGLFFGAVGHGLQPPFDRYWVQHNGLMIFGYPLSEVYSESDAVVGKEIPVQWFERARMEFHSDMDAQWQIQLSQLGRLLLFGRR
jgi:hypothetical protein